MRSQRKNKTKHTHTHRPRMHLKCVCECISTDANLLNALVEPPNKCKRHSTSFFLLFLRLFVHFVSLYRSACVCVSVYVLLLLLLSLLRSTTSPQLPILLLLFVFIIFMDFHLFVIYFWMSLGDGDVQQPIMYLFSFFLASLHSRMYVCRF